MTCNTWFGTQDYALWIQTPQRGADVSANAWGESGTFLNGGAFAFNSFNSHKTYNFAWRSTSARSEAQTMMSFFSGSFGRGKLYFLDPLTMETNVLPARWADPSITCDFEGESLVPGLDPVRVSQTGTERLQLPVFAAQFRFAGQVQAKPQDVGVFVPVPPGYSAVVWGVSSSTGDSGVRVSPVTKGGNLVGTVSTLPNTSANDIVTQGSGSVTLTPTPGQIGLQLWIGGEAEGAYLNGLTTVTALSVEVIPSDRVGDYKDRPRDTWYGGQGNEGVRFTQPPTYINNTGRNGGQVEFAATFKEVAF